MTSSEIYSRLIQHAETLAQGKLLPHIDVDVWYKMTPQAERRRIVAAMEAAEERHKVLALDMRDLADSLRRRTSLPTEGKP